MSKIKSIKAYEIEDSRGNPTVEVELALSDSRRVVASCPSGASTGKNEAVALPAEEAIENVNKIIAKKLVGKNPEDQKELDALMINLDGTESKSKLGANAILPVSMAICRAGAAARKVSLYNHIASISVYGIQDRGYRMLLPMFNFVEGGAHTIGRNTLDLQEFMVVPQKKSFAENLQIANRIFNTLQKIVVENYGEQKEMGDEGGFVPNISKAEQALFLLKNAIGNEDAKIAIDAAASQFFVNGKYMLESKQVSRQELMNFYKDLSERFDVISIEDPFAEEDWEGFKLISNFKFQNSNLLIVGDDLTTTNVKRIKEAHSKNACNGVIIKPNQIGTVTETIESVKLAKSYGWKTVVSHRSGETMDTFISDLAVGVGADYIKAGSPAQPERMLKYSRLLEIEDELHQVK